MSSLLLANMHEFARSPKYSSDWWRKQPTINPFVGIGDDEENHINRDSVMIWAMNPNDMNTGWPGELILFPTITDALLWLRWVVLAIESGGEGDAAEDIELKGKSIKIAKLIDDAPRDSSSYDVFEEAYHQVYFTSIALSMPQSIDSYLASTSSEEEWRLIFDDPSIRFENGKWTFTETQWKEVIHFWRELFDQGWLGSYENIAFEMLNNKNNAV